jgi:hypothetical protein
VTEKTGPHVCLTHGNSILTLRLGRGQKISLEMYAMNGKLVHRIFPGRFLEAGTHSFPLRNRMLSNRIFILRVKGDGVDESMLITMSPG